MNIETELQSLAMSVAIADLESATRRRVARALFMVALVVTSRLLAWDTIVTVTTVLAVREILPALYLLRVLHKWTRQFNQLISRV